MTSREGARIFDLPRPPGVLDRALDTIAAFLKDRHIEEVEWLAAAIVKTGSRDQDASGSHQVRRTPSGARSWLAQQAPRDP